MKNPKLNFSILLNVLLAILLAIQLAPMAENEPKPVALNPTNKNYVDMPKVESYVGLPSGLVDGKYPSSSCGQSVDKEELGLTVFRINFNYCPTVEILNYEMITPYQILMAASGDQPEGKRIEYWMNARLTTFVTAIDHWDVLNPDPGIEYVDNGSDISKFYVQIQSNGEFGCIGPDANLVKNETAGVFSIHRGQLQVRRWFGKCDQQLALAKELNITVHP